LNPEKPPLWKLVTSNVRLPAHEPLTQYKTCSKLPQILARAEADAAGADDALLLNNEGFVVEGSSSNLFWVQEDFVCTPPLPSGILPGVTRAIVFELCPKLGLPTRESNANHKQLLEAGAVFLSLTSLGIVQCQSLNGVAVGHSPLVEKLSHAYQDLLVAETSQD
jgi:branched-chain amino acid aminotransferase